MNVLSKIPTLFALVSMTMSCAHWSTLYRFEHTRITTMPNGSKVYLTRCQCLSRAQAELTVATVCPKGYRIIDIAPRSTVSAEVRFTCKGSYPTHVNSGIKVVANPLLDPSVHDALPDHFCYTEKPKSDIPKEAPIKKAPFKSNW